MVNYLVVLIQVYVDLFISPSLNACLDGETKTVSTMVLFAKIARHLNLDLSLVMCVLDARLLRRFKLHIDVLVSVTASGTFLILPVRFKGFRIKRPAINW